MSQHTSENQRSKDWLEKVKESVAIVGGVTAILAALLWYLGRRYGAGLFDVMRIPLYQVKLSVWDYGEVSWPFIVAGLMASFLIIPLVYRSYISEYSEDAFLHIIGNRARNFLLL